LHGRNQKEKEKEKLKIVNARERLIMGHESFFLSVRKRKWV
jgi:hypothetical protein